MFCEDQTRIQGSYTGSRDKCREVAEMKASMQGITPNAQASKSQKTRLVDMFSNCMNNQGWAVPGPADEEEESTSPAQPVVAPRITAAPAMPMTLPPPPNAAEVSRKRAAECAFARQAANSSIIARKRAEACDIECAQAWRAKPDAAPSPACK